MVEEIRFLRDRFGLIYFSIRDDTFTADRRRVIDFCRKLLSERIFILWNCQSRVNAVDAELLGWMKRAGCECVQLGIESGSRKVLDILGKRITPEQVRAAAQAVREVGINLSIYLIAGVKGETESDVQETCSLVSALRPSGGHVSPLVYYPGTALFEDAVKAGDVPSDLFEKSREPACQVCRDRSVSRNTERLMAVLEKGARKSGFTARDFRQQKELLGYCHATNLLAGESFLETGSDEAAEREYREIVDREPDNPWGWLALGEMYGEAGDLDSAIRAFETLAGLVPQHVPAFNALGELYDMSGDRKKAKANLDRAQLLEKRIG
jgi:tetratricopeptide (TPR) repeat protein